MRKILLVLDDNTVNLREILTDEVRMGLKVLDLTCKDKGIQITPEMVSEVIGHKVIETQEISHNPYEELLKSLAPFTPEMIPKIRDSDLDYLESKPSKKIPRNRRYSSPDWNF